MDDAPWGFAPFHYGRWARIGPRYVTQVNQNIVVNNTVNITNNHDVYRYQRESAAVTTVSRDDFAHGQPVHGDQHLLSANDLSRAGLVAERSALPPAAVIKRPVVGSRDDRRDEPSAGRPDNKNHNPRAQPPVPAAPVTPGFTGQQTQRDQ